MDRMGKRRMEELEAKKPKDLTTMESAFLARMRKIQDKEQAAERTAKQRHRDNIELLARRAGS